MRSVLIVMMLWCGCSVCSLAELAGFPENRSPEYEISEVCPLAVTSLFSKAIINDSNIQYQILSGTNLSVDFILSRDKAISLNLFANRNTDNGAVGGWSNWLDYNAVSFDVLATGQVDHHILEVRGSSTNGEFGGCRWYLPKNKTVNICWEFPLGYTNWSEISSRLFLRVPNFGLVDPAKQSMSYFISNMQLEKRTDCHREGWDVPGDCIVVNHSGFVPHSQKQAYLSMGPPLPDSRFYLLPHGDMNEAVFTGDTSRVTLPDQRQIVVCDFSSFTNVGEYAVKCGTLRSRSFPISSDVYEDALDMEMRFLQMVRSGTNTAWHPPTHLDDRAPDGRDLVGGYHDAGGCRKYLSTAQHVLRAMGMMRPFLADLPESAVQMVLEETVWAGKFLAKMEIHREGVPSGGLYTYMTESIANWTTNEYTPSKTKNIVIYAGRMWGNKWTDNVVNQLHTVRPVGATNLYEYNDDRVMRTNDVVHGFKNKAEAYRYVWSLQAAANLLLDEQVTTDGEHAVLGEELAACARRLLYAYDSRVWDGETPITAPTDQSAQASIIGAMMAMQFYEYYCESDPDRAARWKVHALYYLNDVLTGFRPLPEVFPHSKFRDYFTAFRVVKDGAPVETSYHDIKPFHYSFYEGGAPYVLAYACLLFANDDGVDAWQQGLKEWCDGWLDPSAELTAPYGTVVEGLYDYPKSHLPELEGITLVNTDTNIAAPRYVRIHRDVSLEQTIAPDINCFVNGVEYIKRTYAATSYVAQAENPRLLLCSLPGRVTNVYRASSGQLTSQTFYDTGPAQGLYTRFLLAQPAPRAYVRLMGAALSAGLAGKALERRVLDTHSAKLYRHAENQVRYLLGGNPFDSSAIFGFGRNNPLLFAGVYGCPPGAMGIEYSVNSAGFPSQYTYGWVRDTEEPYIGGANEMYTPVVANMAAALSAVSSAGYVEGFNIRDRIGRRLMMSEGGRPQIRWPTRRWRRYQFTVVDDLMNPTVLFSTNVIAGQLETLFEDPLFEEGTRARFYSIRELDL